jgi:hypothetical protein
VLILRLLRQIAGHLRTVHAQLSGRRHTNPTKHVCRVFDIDLDDTAELERWILADLSKIPVHTRTRRDLR